METRERIEIISRLAKHNIEAREEDCEDAITSDTLPALPYMYAEGRIEDIKFALEDTIKLLRPYPKRK